MRSISVFAAFAAVASLAASLAAIGDAAAQPLWQAELRAGYGVAMSGSGETMSARATPLTLTALVSFAFNEEPPVAGYGGIIVETLDHNASGAVFGVQLTPRGSRVRLAGGGVWLVAPYTLWGATASIGACVHATRRFGLCGDLQLTAYVGGSDLPSGRAVNQGQVLLGVVFDAP